MVFSCVVLCLWCGVVVVGFIGIFIIIIILMVMMVWIMVVWVGSSGVVVVLFFVLYCSGGVFVCWLCWWVGVGYGGWYIVVWYLYYV